MILINKLSVGFLHIPYNNMKSTWSDNLYEYYTSLKPPKHLPNDIKWLQPLKEITVRETLRQFLAVYYNDGENRLLVLGINPGRLGAGVTGVNFTAPKQLSEYCNIKHPLKNQSELSAEFIYTVINAYGGVQKFYKKYFLGAICPLGFIQHGKNLNYYDDKELLHIVRPFIIQSIEKLLSFPVNRRMCLCIGEEKNFKFLSSLNEKYDWFDNITAVPHPRFIMQYKRKKMQEYVQLYLDALD